MKLEENNILIVDDEDDICEILRFNLISEGFTADVAHSAEEAFEKNLHAYDLVLLDVMMGDISGFNLIQYIRHDKGLSVPVIFLTARTSEEDRRKGIRLGCDDYITKPFSINEVLERIKALLNRSSHKQLI